MSRNKAQQLISAGLVSVNGVVTRRAHTLISPETPVILTDDRRVHFVSRSAEKLHSFLCTHPEITLWGTNCLDVGSSTGGFTQVLLISGAKHIDAVDVWSAQLHISLRTDQRVTSYENMDIRDYPVTNPYDIIVCDVSFISLEKVLPAILSHAQHHTEIILLYKPQFEVGRAYLRKTGVPRDTQRVSDCKKQFEWLLQSSHLLIHDIRPATLCGEAGNQEWIYWVRIDNTNI